MSDEEKKKPKKPGAMRHLTVAQKAEAVALWRTGSVTLEDLGKKYKKQPETLSRLFSRMGIVKGSGAEEAAKKIVASAEARMLSDTEEAMRKISATRDEHYRMSSGLAKLAWAEIVRAQGRRVDGLAFNPQQPSLTHSADSGRSASGRSADSLSRRLNCRRW